MNMYVDAKYDMYIIITCIGILMFISCMITAEIEKRKDKLRYAIINLLLIIGFFLIIIASQTFDLESFFIFFIYVSGLFILGTDIISFIIKKKHSNENSQSIKIKCEWVRSIIIYIIITLLNEALHPSYEVVVIYIIVVLLVDLPITYSVNHYLNLYESGIAISTFSFPKKVIPYNEIISYDNIEIIEFFKRENNKYVLNINVKNSNKKSPYEYIINSESKEEFISFIEKYFDQNKIIHN